MEDGWIGKGSERRPLASSDQQSLVGQLGDTGDERLARIQSSLPAYRIQRREIAASVQMRHHTPGTILAHRHQPVVERSDLLHSFGQHRPDQRTDGRPSALFDGKGGGDGVQVDQRVSAQVERTEIGTRPGMAEPRAGRCACTVERHDMPDLRDSLFLEIVGAGCAEIGDVAQPGEAIDLTLDLSGLVAELTRIVIAQVARSAP